jgi:L-asparagine oxygenase
MPASPNIPSPAPTEIGLTHEDRDAIIDATDAIQAYDPITEAEQFATEAQIRAALLSEPVRRALLHFRRHGSPIGGLLIRDVPTGPIPETPSRADQGVGIGLQAAAAMSMIAGALGDQYGFRAELGGNIIQDVLPVAGAEKTQRSVSSDVRLKDHVEMAFADHRSDYVGLLCVRPDHERVAGTTLSSVERLLPQLDITTVQTLREPRYKTTVDESFLIGGGFGHPIWIGPIAVLTDSIERPRLRADFAETEGTDSDAQEALERLRDAVAAAAVTILLEEGDLLLIDNHRAFHGRTSFRARGDGLDRWLLRTFVTKDLSRSEAVRPSDGRIVDTDYSAGADVLVEEMRIRRAEDRVQR